MSKGNHGICILLESYYPVLGGMESQAAALNKTLKESNVNIRVITRHIESGTEKEEYIDGIYVKRIFPSGYGVFKRWIMVITSMYYLIENVFNYDTIFVYGFRSLGIAGVLVSKIFRKHCVLKASNIGEMSGEYFDTGLGHLGLSKNFLFYRILLNLRNNLLMKADAFVSFSPKITNEFKNCRIKSEKIFEIPNLFDEDQFYKVAPGEKIELKNRLNLPLNKKILIYTGRLTFEKGLPLLLKVWYEINKIHNGILLLVGSGQNLRSSCEDTLRKFVKDNNLEDSVIFIGKIDMGKVNEYLKASDIFVLPSDDEAFGNSLIEAMACGLASVSTSFIIDHGHNGFSFEPGNFDQLYYYIDLLLKNSQLRNELGENAVRTVREKYSRAKVVNSYIKLFNSFYSPFIKLKPRQV